MGEGNRTDDEWVHAMRDTTRVLARAQYAHVESVTGYYRRGVAADLIRSGGWHTAAEGATATAVAAVMMRMSEYAVTGLVDVGLSLDGLPRTKEAFSVGDLDLARVRAIVDVTTGCNEGTRLELDRRLADLGTGCAAPGLRSSGRRWAAKLDPDGVAERRRRTVEDRDVRVSAARDGMAVLNGWLPVEAAQMLAHRLADMAKQQVCTDDPRTFPQRRADALVALADGTARLICRCSLGADCPKVGGASPAGPAGVVHVGVSLETLLGLRDWPGYLSGAGAIDADLARTLAKDGRWEWIIAAIDAAATMANSDTTSEPAACVPSGNDSAYPTTATTSSCSAGAEFAGGGADSEPADGGADTKSADGSAVAGRADNSAAIGTVDRSADDDHPGDMVHNAASASGARDSFGAGDQVATDTAVGSDDADETIAVPVAKSTDDHPPDTGRPSDSETGTDSGPTRPAQGRTRMSAAARKAIAAACTATIRGWDAPDTEAALRYAWPEKLAAWIRARDVTCRFPNCHVPARNCDIDHTIRYDHNDPRSGGRTIRTNAACLCRRHHRLKTDGENRSGGWRVRQLDGRGRLAWTSPAGDVIVTEPEGVEFLWPETDLVIAPLPPPRLPTAEERELLRAQGEEIAARYGLALTDTTAIASRYDETAEHCEFIAAAYPRRQVRTAGDDPPPF